MRLESLRPAIDDWVARHREDCIGFLQDLVAIPSATTAGEDEAAIADRLVEELEALDYDDVRVDGIGNVHGVIHGEHQDEGAVMLNAHIDTVGVGDAEQWTHDPYGGEIEAGQLYGLGAADMLCAMAAMVYGGGALAALDVTPTHDVYVTGEVLEEVHEGHAMRYAIEEDGLDLGAVVIGEATEMDVKRGHRGRCELQIELEGSSCHASAPERGVNPLYHADDLLQRIEAANGETADDDFLGKGTVAATNLEVDTPSNNAVPAGATLYVDRRLTVGEDEDGADAELEAAVAAAREAHGDEVAARVETLTFDGASYTGYAKETPKYYPTWVLEPDHPLVLDTVDVVATMLDREPAIRKWTFSTSGNYTRGVAGIPTVGFGPSREEHAHAPDERVAVDDVVDAVGVYAGLAAEL
ncbi:MAG: YgeY family selenium metabolism-linked hydrolase [Halobacteriales archaeon]